MTSTIPKGDPQERIKITQKKVDPEEHPGKENELEAQDRNTIRLMNFQTFD